MLELRTFHQKGNMVVEKGCQCCSTKEENILVRMAEGSKEQYLVANRDKNVLYILPSGMLQNMKCQRGQGQHFKNHKTDEDQEAESGRSWRQMSQG